MCIRDRMSTTQNWMLAQSLCINFTTTTKSTMCCFRALQRDPTCFLPSKIYRRTQKLAGHGLVVLSK
eukprot:6195706-Pleurochrysis_carterae.AAC.1